MKLLILLSLLLLPLNCYAVIATTTPITISPLATDQTNLGGNSLAQVATNPSGNAVAVWQNTALGGNILRNTVRTIVAATYSSITGIWSTSLTIGVGYDPQVAIDSSGNAIAIWVNGPQSNLSWAIQSAYFTAATGTWSAVVNIPTVRPLQNKALYTPHIVMTAAGNAMVVWSDGFNDQIYGSNFLAGGPFVWTTPTQISVTSGVFPQISLATTTEVATVVWQTTLQTAAKIEIQSSFILIAP